MQVIGLFWSLRATEMSLAPKTAMMTFWTSDYKPALHLFTSGLFSLVAKVNLGYTVAGLARCIVQRGPRGWRAVGIQIDGWMGPLDSWGFSHENGILNVTTDCYISQFIADNCVCPRSLNGPGMSVRMDLSDENSRHGTKQRRHNTVEWCVKSVLRYN